MIWVEIVGRRRRPPMAPAGGATLGFEGVPPAALGGLLLTAGSQLLWQALSYSGQIQPQRKNKGETSSRFKDTR